MFRHFLAEGLLASVQSAVGVETGQKLEKQRAGGKALSVRAVTARHTLMAAAIGQMKRHAQRRISP